MQSLLRPLLAGESLLRNLNKLIVVFGVSLLCLIWAGVYYQLDNERQAELRSAIRDTANMARAGDIVVIAGKGHENYQEIEGVRHWFDDVVEVQSAIDAQHHTTDSAYPAH